MKLCVFGLTVSSSWGNGHATLWRGLIGALAQQGWQVTFFGRDLPYYAENRDLRELPGCRLVPYPDWASVEPLAAEAVAESDVAMVTSYCPDGRDATALVLEARSALRVFYDLDTPVTLSEFRLHGETAYIGPEGLSGYDIVLSYTGGAALEELRTLLGARRTAALYGHVDPAHYGEAEVNASFAGDLSNLGTYAADRQEAVETFLVDPARMKPDRRFVIGGAQYPVDFPWTANIHFVRHLPPGGHPSFYASSRLTLNVTRQAMAVMGWCPSGRLFEAGACGATILSDTWSGLDEFFEPGEEIIPIRSSDDVLAALDVSDAERVRIGRRARERVLSQRTSAHRAAELEAILAATRSGASPLSGQA